MTTPLFFSALIVSIFTLVATRTIWRSLTRHIRNQEKRILLSPSFVAALSWLAYVIVLLPTLGIFCNHVWGLAADRYSYIPMLLIGTPVCAFTISELLNSNVFSANHKSKNNSVVRKAWYGFFVVAITLITILYAYQSSLMLESWRSWEPFWKRMIDINPLDEVPHNNFGNMLLRSGNALAAAPHYEEAIRLNQKYTTAIFNMANCTIELNRYSEAVHFLERGLQMQPNFPIAHDSYGALLENVGRYEDAAAAYRQSLELTGGKSEKARIRLSILRSRGIGKSLASDQKDSPSP